MSEERRSAELPQDLQGVEPPPGLTGKELAAWERKQTGIEPLRKGRVTKWRAYCRMCPYAQEPTTKQKAKLDMYRHWINHHEGVVAKLRG